MLISIVIRTYNESRYLGELLAAVSRQRAVLHPLTGEMIDVETVIVDSGSTDDTLAIARQHGARITHISKAEFTFGRSLNVGCEFASGEVLVFVSGHCIPIESDWLNNLVAPLLAGDAAYSYGRQVGQGDTKFSEERLFEKHFPERSAIPQQGYFCNNANAALLKKIWLNYRFDEQLTGLEDLELAKRLVSTDEKIAYCADAPVFHLHDESWSQVRYRYEREAVALQSIMPELHFGIRDFIKCIGSGVFSDCMAAYRKGRLARHFVSIWLFRCNQFYGVLNGHRQHRALSHQRKLNYYYPTIKRSETEYEKKENRRISPAESK